MADADSGVPLCSVVLITGSVGVGKSECIKHLISVLPREAKPAVIGASRPLLYFQTIRSYLIFLLFSIYNFCCDVKFALLWSKK